jgi:hypothetical protein
MKLIQLCEYLDLAPDAPYLDPKNKAKKIKPKGTKTKKKDTSFLVQPSDRGEYLLKMNKG